MPRKPKKPVTFASTSWCVDDVLTAIQQLDIKPTPRWSRARCEQFLARNEKWIVSAMVSRGWETLAQCLREDLIEEQQKEAQP